MKNFCIVLIVSILLASCVTTKPNIQVDNQNIFTSNRPELKLLIEKKFDFVESFKFDTKTGKYKYKTEYSVFRSESGKSLVLILVNRFPMNSTYKWLPLKIEKGKNGVILDQGPAKLAGRYWHRFTQVVSLSAEEQNRFMAMSIPMSQYYVAQCCARNYSDKTQVYVMYLESLDGFEKDIEQYNRIKTLTTEQAEKLSDFVGRAEKSILFL